MLQFTKSTTFETILTECLQTQEKATPYISGLPLLSASTKSYKELCEILHSQLKIVFEAYLSEQRVFTEEHRKLEQELANSKLLQINTLNNNNNNNLQRPFSSQLGDMSSVVMKADPSQSQIHSHSQLALLQHQIPTQSNYNNGHPSLNFNSMLQKFESNQVLRLGSMPPTLTHQPLGNELHQDLNSQPSTHTLEGQSQINLKLKPHYQQHYLQQQHYSSSQENYLQLQNTASASLNSLHNMNIAMGVIGCNGEAICTDNTFDCGTAGDRQFNMLGGCGGGLDQNGPHHYKTGSNDFVLTETLGSMMQLQTLNNGNNLNLMMQTQELQTENDYLRAQMMQLQKQVEVAQEAQAQVQALEETQHAKESELKELVDMVRDYETQIKELQVKLEQQIEIHHKRETTNQLLQTKEIQAHQEIQQVKLLFQEFILAKDEIEKDLEELVKGVLERDIQLSLQQTGATNATQKNSHSTQQSTLQKFQDGFSSRKIQDIMRTELAELREMQEVLKDLKKLVQQMLQEKQQLRAQLNCELDLRGQIEKALEDQDTEGLSRELLIMKVKTLEHAVNGIQNIFDTQLEQASSSQSPQYVIQQQLKLFSTEFLEDKARLADRYKRLESQCNQLNEDLQALLTRLEESEKENTQLRLKGDKKIEEEKLKLLQEVEEIRTREEMLEKEIQLKLEEEILRMQIEQEKEIKCAITQKLQGIVSVLEVSSNDKEMHSRRESENELDMDTIIAQIEAKAKRLVEKVNVLQENKELMTKERMIFEDRMNEFSYENSLATKQVEQLHSQLQETINGYQSELKTLKEDNQKLAENVSLLMGKFRQAASELHEVREEREKLKKELIQMQDLLDSYKGGAKQNHQLQNNSLISSQHTLYAKPPILNHKITDSNSNSSLSPLPQNLSMQLQSARASTAVPQARKQPIQIYNSLHPMSSSQLQNNSNSIANQSQQFTTQQNIDYPLRDLMEEDAPYLNSVNNSHQVFNYQEQLTSRRHNDTLQQSQIQTQQRPKPQLLSPGGGGSGSGSLPSQSKLRSSIDENQLSDLIKDYKKENQKFSQKVQELQKKIQSTAQLSPLKDESQSKIAQYSHSNSSQPRPHVPARASSSKPLQQRNTNLPQSANSQATRNSSTNPSNPARPSPKSTYQPSSMFAAQSHISQSQNAVSSSSSSVHAPRSDLNKKYFSTINTEELPSARIKINGEKNSTATPTNLMSSHYQPHSYQPILQNSNQGGGSFSSRGREGGTEVAGKRQNSHSGTRQSNSGVKKR